MAVRGFHFPEAPPAGFVAVAPGHRVLNLVPEARHGNETFRGWLENSADSL
jgi:hypothetical protein